MELLEREAKIKHAFELIDADGNGAISCEELRDTLQRQGGGSPLSVEEAEALVSEFDVNDDGQLQYEEFALLWASLLEAQQEASGVNGGKHLTCVTVKDDDNVAASDDAGGDDESGDINLSTSFKKAISNASSSFKKAAFSAGSFRRGAAFSMTLDRLRDRMASTPANAAARARELERHSLAPSQVLTAEAQSLRSQADDVAQAPPNEESLDVRLGKSLWQLVERGTASRGSGVSFSGAAADGSTNDNNTIKAPRRGSIQAATLDKLVRAWDKNGDGDLSLSELRLAIRNSLKTQASEQEIKELLNRYDVDGGGKLDVDELRPLLRNLWDAYAQGIAGDGARDGEASVLLRLAAASDAAAQATLLLERAERELTRILETQPLMSRLGLGLLRTRRKLKPLVEQWPGGVAGYATFDVLIDGLRRLQVQPSCRGTALRCVVYRSSLLWTHTHLPSLLLHVPPHSFTPTCTGSLPRAPPSARLLWLQVPGGISVANEAELHAWYLQRQAEGVAKAVCRIGGGIPLKEELPSLLKAGKVALKEEEAAKVKVDAAHRQAAGLQHKMRLMAAQADREVALKAARAELRESHKEKGGGRGRQARPAAVKRRGKTHNKEHICCSKVAKNCKNAVPNSTLNRKKSKPGPQGLPSCAPKSPWIA